MNRRAFTQSLATSAIIATEASVASVRGVQALGADIRPADVPGTPLAISPDGTLIAGYDDQNRFCVWDAEIFDTVIRSGPTQDMDLIDEGSVTWSPDNSAVAWSLDAARLMRDSDIYVFDIDTGLIENLTGGEPRDQEAETLPMEQGSGPVLNVDVFPSWSPDSERLYFARTIWGGSPAAGTSLWSIFRDGSEPTEIVTLSLETSLLVSSTMFVDEAGSVLYSTWPPDPDGLDHGVFIVTPDGEVEGISTGPQARETPGMVLMSFAPVARRASLMSTRNAAIYRYPIWLEMDLDTGVITGFEKLLSLPTTREDANHWGLNLFAAPDFLTDENGELVGYLYVTANPGFDVFTLWQHDIGAREPVPLGTFANTNGPSVRQFSRVQVIDDGTAAIFHGGNLWLAQI